MIESHRIAFGRPSEPVRLNVDFYSFQTPKSFRQTVNWFMLSGFSLTCQNRHVLQKFELSWFRFPSSKCNQSIMEKDYSKTPLTFSPKHHGSNKSQKLRLVFKNGIIWFSQTIIRWDFLGWYSCAWVFGPKWMWNWRSTRIQFICFLSTQYSCPVGITVRSENLQKLNHWEYSR